MPTRATASRLLFDPASRLLPPAYIRSFFPFLPTAAAYCVLFVFAAQAAEEAPLEGVESWANRKAWPALVNPVVSSPLQNVLSLRGEWEFVTQPVAPNRHPGWRAFYNKPWPNARTIQVPGCWEAQGVGAPGMSEAWDCKWDQCPKPLRAVYMGEGWYRKKIEIPLTWQGRRVWLKVGGVRAQGWFWVNGKTVAWADNYCGTYKYDITDLVEPGKPATVVAAVSNIVPSRKGLFGAHHKFGGLYRDVELEATPDTRIDYAWVRGDFDKQAAEVHANVVCTSANVLQNPVLKVRVVPASVPAGRDAGTTSAAAGEASQKVDLTAQKLSADVVVNVPLSVFNPWSPESPSLYIAELTLCDGDKPVHGWTERFGVRKIEARGDRFFLNNKPFFIRGFGDDLVYPLTLTSPASREEHLKHLKLAREAGFVYVRTHTHCELPEYFEAADEAGIMIQPELPYYGDYPCEAFTFDPMRDMKEIIAQYRRHVSLTTYCTGNEGVLGKPLDKEIYKLCKRLDPDRLVLHQDGDYNTAENSDFRGGPINVWTPGKVKGDAPFVAHEYLNLCVKLDPRLEPKFTGAWQPPVTLAAWDKRLAAAGLNREWGERIQDAAHALQRYYQKRGLESARLDPACDGYDFWTIVDVVVQQHDSYSSQGLFTPFWEGKQGGATPQEFATFNSPTAILLKMDIENRVLVSGEEIKADFWVSHFGTQNFEKPKFRYALSDNERPLDLAECNIETLEPGAVRPIARVALVGVPEVQRPVRAVLGAVIEAASIGNRWDFWLFPKRSPQPGDGIAISASFREALSPLFANLAVAGTPEAEKCSLLISELSSPDVASALAAGKRVLLINQTGGKPNVNLGWWSMGNQVGTAFAKHPAWGDFPHEGYLSPLMFRILKTGLKLPAFPGLKPEEMFAVGEGGTGFFLYGAEARCGNGRVLMTFGLDLLSGLPEANNLLDNLIRYARSGAFTPKGEIKLP
ncbi:MAG TPA: hypothetical protein VGP72_18280 [Planctomycetota bacterium]|jgi:hypothetical protein